MAQIKTSEQKDAMSRNIAALAPTFRKYNASCHNWTAERYEHYFCAFLRERCKRKGNAKFAPLTWEEVAQTAIEHELQSVRNRIATLETPAEKFAAIEVIIRLILSPGYYWRQQAVKDFYTGGMENATDSRRVRDLRAEVEAATTQEELDEAESKLAAILWPQVLDVDAKITSTQGGDRAGTKTVGETLPADEYLPEDVLEQVDTLEKVFAQIQSKGGPELVKFALELMDQVEEFLAGDCRRDNPTKPRGAYKVAYGKEGGSPQIKKCLSLLEAACRDAGFTPEDFKPYRKPKAFEKVHEVRVHQGRSARSAVNA
jgi:hypothetical protein